MPPAFRCAHASRVTRIRSPRSRSRSISCRGRANGQKARGKRRKTARTKAARRGRRGPPPCPGRASRPAKFLDGTRNSPRAQALIGRKGGDPPCPPSPTPPEIEPDRIFLPKSGRGRTAEALSDRGALPAVLFFRGQGSVEEAEGRRRWPIRRPNTARLSGPGPRAKRPRRARTAPWSRTRLPRARA